MQLGSIVQAVPAISSCLHINHLGEDTFKAMAMSSLDGKLNAPVQTINTDREEDDGMLVSKQAKNIPPYQTLKTLLCKSKRDCMPCWWWWLCLPQGHVVVKQIWQHTATVFQKNKTGSFQSISLSNISCWYLEVVCSIMQYSAVFCRILQVS